MSNNKTYNFIVILILVCFTNNFAQIVIDEYGLDTGFTKEQLDYHKNNYIERCDSLGILKTSFDYFYCSKVNINQYEVYQKLSYDLNEISEHFYHCSKDEILIAPIIVCGKIKRKFGYPDYRLIYHTKFEVEIFDVLKGKEFLDENAKVLYYYTMSGPIMRQDNNTIENESLNDEIIMLPDYNGSISSVNFESYYNIGDEVLLFLTKYGYQFYKLYKPPKNHRGSYILNADIVKLNHYQSMLSYLIEENEIYDEISHKRISIEEIREEAKLLEKINDTPNFYKRSYK